MDDRSMRRKAYHLSPENRNLTNHLFDLKAIQEFRNKIESTSGHKVLYEVDNTYMGPMWQKPMEWGADVSVHHEPWRRDCGSGYKSDKRPD
jgi:methionine-gamma-lyase